MKAFIIVCLALISCAAAQPTRAKRLSVLPVGVRDAMTLGTLGVDRLGFGLDDTVVDPLDVGLLNRVGGARSLDLVNRRLIDPIDTTVVDPITGEIIDPITGRLIRTMDSRFGRTLWDTPTRMITRW